MKKVAIIVGVLFILVIGIGYVMFQSQRAAMAKASQADKDVLTVAHGDVVLKVIETGTIDAVKAVDVRSRASGRLSRLLADEGDSVSAGQLIAIIDPQEIEFQVAQTQAQLRGARSGAARTMIELEQRRVTAKAAYDQAVARLEQIRKELQIQPTLTSASVRSTQAALNSAVQERDRLSRSIHPTQRTAAESELGDATASFETAKLDFDRITELQGKGYVAGQSLDAAKLRFEQARIRRDKARTDLERLGPQQRLELDSANESVRRAQADLDRAQANTIQDDVKRREYESAQAAVSSAKAQLRDVEVLKKSHDQGMASVSQLESVVGDSMRQLRETQVRSPLDGVISKKNVEVGDMVTGLSAFTQGTAIFRIEDRTALRVMLEINEIDVARLRLEMPVQVEVDSFPDRGYRGKIKKIAPSSTAMQPVAGGAPGSSDAVVKYQVEVWLDEADPKLRSGMSAKCTFETVSKKNVLRLPVEYVGKDKDGRFVMLAPPKGSKQEPKRQAITVGVTTGAFAEITSGIREGDRVTRPDYKGPARKGFMQMGPDEETGGEENSGSGK